MTSNEVQVGNGLASAEEGASLSPQPPIVEPVQPPEPTPEYLTKAEALELRRELQQTESRVRGLQSVIDKTAAQRKRLEERYGGVEAMLAAQVADGTLDETEASRYRQQARVEALYAQEPEAGEPVDDGGVVGQQASDPYQATAEARLKASGLIPSDPEMAALANQPDPFEWAVALEQAKTAKAARLARELAAVQAARSPGAPQPTPAQTGATAQDVGTGGVVETTDLGVLRSQFQAAVRSGDQGEMRRVGALVDKVTRGG